MSIPNDIPKVIIIKRKNIYNQVINKTNPCMDQLLVLILLFTLIFILIKLNRSRLF